MYRLCARFSSVSQTRTHCSDFLSFPLILEKSVLIAFSLLAVLLLASHYLSIVQ